MTLLFLFYSAIIIRTAAARGAWQWEYGSVCGSVLSCFSFAIGFACAYILDATSLHKPIMVSLRHAVATNDDAIIHIAAMPSVSRLGVLLQYFFVLSSLSSAYCWPSRTRWLNRVCSFDIILLFFQYALAENVCVCCLCHSVLLLLPAHNNISALPAFST